MWRKLRKTELWMEESTCGAMLVQSFLAQVFLLLNHFLHIIIVISLLS